MHDGREFIAIDFDGVVADTNSVKARWIKEHLGLEVEALRCNRTQCVPMIGEEAYEKLSLAVYGRGLTLKTPEVPGMAAAVEELSRRWRLAILTARGSASIAAATEWLELHGVHGYFEDIMSCEVRAKVDAAHEIRARSLVDDDLRHLLVPRHSEIQRLLFRSPTDDLMPSSVRITPVNSWVNLVQWLGKNG